MSACAPPTARRSSGSHKHETKGSALMAAFLKLSPRHLCAAVLLPARLCVVSVSIPFRFEGRMPEARMIHEGAARRKVEGAGAGAQRGRKVGGGCGAGVAIDLRSRGGPRGEMGVLQLQENRHAK